MVNEKERTKNVIIVMLFIILSLAVFVYFILRSRFWWVQYILPEFVGVAWISIMVAISVKKNTPLGLFMAGLLVIFILAVLGFSYGGQKDIHFLVDIMPEFMGNTLIGLILSLMVRKKVMVI